MNPIIDPPGIVQHADALTQLACAINSEHKAVAAAINKGIAHARVAGELLLKAKAGCGHGNWLPWLVKNCPSIGPRQAQKYMRLARVSNANPNSHLTIDEALAELRTNKSDELREQAEQFRDEHPREAMLFESLALLSEVLDSVPVDGGSEWLLVVKRVCDAASEAKEVAVRMYIESLTALGKLLNERQNDKGVAK